LLRIASVNYLNARPLIAGLAAREDIRLTLDVPARLVDGLQDDRYDVALLPVIDYQRMEGLTILPSGAIGCDGPTLTVRVFSHVAPGQVATLACDPDSHTSVALARVVLRERYGVTPEFVPLDQASARDDEARLLIGDKVVCEEPVGFAHQIDLGAAWKDLTGLPFVFAIWVARGGVDVIDLGRRLAASRAAGMADLERIIQRYAVPRGWPAGLALQYLSVYLKYEVGERQLEAIRLFHQKAAALGVIPSPPRPLVVAPLPGEPAAVGG
jgi:chorismate dehydratase